VVVFAFEKLVVYQKAKEFRGRMYKLSKILPPEDFRLKTNMRDAARSLTNNVAEGHGRCIFKERIRFCRDARGSLQELIDDVSIFEQEGYAKLEHSETLRVDGEKILKLINGYMYYLQECAQAKKTEKRSSKKLQPLTP
jgi:four helix bundle protein